MNKQELKALIDSLPENADLDKVAAEARKLLLPSSPATPQVPGLTLEARKEKLRNIKTSIPGAPPEMVEFASHLAERIKMNNDPEDFIDLCRMTMSDLRKGRDGFSGKNLESSFRSCSSDIADDIMMTVVPFLAAEVLPGVDSSQMRQRVRNAGLAVLF